MKKLIAFALAVLMLMTSFVGCKKEDDNLASAVDYIINMYQTGSKDEVVVLNADKDVLKTVTVDGVSYEVDWTVTVTDGAADAVKVSESDKENHVKIDLPDSAETDLLFTATATVKNADGKTAAAEFKYKMSCTLGDLEVVDKAYALTDGQKMSGSNSLAGVITEIKKPWDAAAKTITVVIQVGEVTDKLITCTALQGEKADTLAVGDDVCVTGVLSNKAGVIGFNDGCSLVYVNKATTGTSGADNATTTTTQKNDSSANKTPTPTKNNGGNNASGNSNSNKAPSDPKAIVDAAYKLAEDAKLDYTATLTGKVTAVNDLYSAEFQNITVTIQVSGRESKPIKCFRMKGNGIDKIAKGDTITVTGILKNHKGTIEFDTGCTMDKRVSGGGKVETVLTDPKQIVDAAFKLAQNQEMAYDVTLTGQVEYIETPYSSDYDNISVYFKVEGKSILCYRMKGNGVANIKAGDKITVTGRIKNHYGTVEFNFPTLDKRVAGTATNEKTLKVVTDPKVNTAYKFGMVQENVSKEVVYFLKGGMQATYYLATAPSVGVAIDVYLENANGGYYMYTKYSGSKQYINLVPSSDGKHVNAYYQNDAKTVYTFDSTMQTLTSQVNGEAYYFGTAQLKNGNPSLYTTVSGVRNDDIFYCKLYQ